MENNIKIWRKQVLKSEEPSFFMVNQKWVDQNMKFCDKHGLLIEYPEVEKDSENLEEKPKKAKKQSVDMPIEEENKVETNQDLDNEEVK